MRILLIGGNGFIGRFVAAELIQQRHAVAVFHRGTTAALAGVEEVRGDRNQLSASAQELKRFAPDVVIDLVISSGPQAEELMNVFRGATHRVVMLSSIDVYRAVGISHGTESGPLQEVPLTEESELRRSLHPYPPEGVQLMRKIFSWVMDDYDKIPAERVVMNDPELPGTVLRLPMAYGPGDPLHRFYPVVKRIADRRRQIIFPETLAAWRSPRGTSRTWPRPLRWLPQMNAQRDVSTTCARSHRSANWNGRGRSPPRCGGMGTSSSCPLSTRRSTC
jgi:nucleoside-diphosphate-sugar epimerase